MTPPVQPQPQIQGQPAVPPLDPRPVTGAELNRRIQHGDQNFPPELWGRTMGEAMRYYSIMRQDFIRQQQAGQRQPQLQGQPQPGQPQQPQTPPAAPQSQYRGPDYQQPPQGQLQPQHSTGYIPPQPQQPVEVPLTLDAVQRVVEQTLSRAMAPMAQASAVSVQQQMRGRFPDWAQYEQAILAELQGADPSQLLNPQLWESAYYFVKGKWATENPQRQQVIFDPGSPMQRAASAPGGPIYQPVPSEFFSEAPTAPNQVAANGQLNDPMDEVYARRFGMPVEEYRAWKGGRVPVPQRQQQPSNGTGRGW